MKSEAAVKKEFELLNQLKPGLKVMDFFQLCTLYPSATSCENFQRNRYKDVLPEERTRVKLQYQRDDDSDYINANYISGHKEKYISCQAPLPHTTNHFWRMIWEQDTPVIIMLTKTVEGERKKADVYWPNAEGEKLTFGIITISLKTVLKLTNITIRVISLKNSKSEEEREVVHLHYTEWPDFGVPETTHKIRELIRLMNFYKERAESKGLKGPIVTHCSAGIGRCGTYLGILISLEKLMERENFEQIDLVDIVTKMRASRCGMVQTEFQYKFIYQVLDDIVKEKQLKQLKSSGKRISLCLSYDETSDSDDIKPELRRCSCSMPSELKRVSSSISCQP